jgi:hypothetical protein
MRASEAKSSRGRLYAELDSGRFGGMFLRRDKEEEKWQM